MAEIRAGSAEQHCPSNIIRHPDPPKLAAADSGNRKLLECFLIQLGQMPSLFSKAYAGRNAQSQGCAR